jgi:hypothetical protein
MLHVRKGCGLCGNDRDMVWGISPNGFSVSHTESPGNHFPGSRIIGELEFSLKMLTSKLLQTSFCSLIRAIGSGP